MSYPDFAEVETEVQRGTTPSPRSRAAEQPGVAGIEAVCLLSQSTKPSLCAFRLLLGSDAPGTLLQFLSHSAPKQAGLWCPAHKLALTSAGRKLPPSLAQGSERQPMAQLGTCPTLSPLGLNTDLEAPLCLRLKRTQKKGKVTSVCVTRTKIAHSWISPGQPGSFWVFPAGDILRDLLTLSCVQKSSKTKLIPAQGLPCPVTTQPRSRAEGKR